MTPFQRTSVKLAVLVAQVTSPVDILACSISSTVHVLFGLIVYNYHAYLAFSPLLRKRAYSTCSDEDVVTPGENFVYSPGYFTRNYMSVTLFYTIKRSYLAIIEVEWCKNLKRSAHDEAFEARR